MGIGFFIKNSLCGIFMGVMLQKLVLSRVGVFNMPKISHVAACSGPSVSGHANAQFGITLLSISCLSYDNVFLR